MSWAAAAWTARRSASSPRSRLPETTSRSVAGEQVGLVVRDENPRADLGRLDLVEACGAPGRCRRGKAAETVDHRRGVRRPGADQSGQRPGDHLDPGLGIVEDGGRLGPVQRRRRRLPDRRFGLQGQEAGDSARGDQTAADVVAAFDEEGDRHDENRRVAVHRDQFADGELALRGHPGRQPGHGAQEQGGQADAECLDPAGHHPDPVPLRLQLLRTAPVALGVDVLAADAVEDTQTAA